MESREEKDFYSHSDGKREFRTDRRERGKTEKWKEKPGFSALFSPLTSSPFQTIPTRRATGLKPSQQTFLNLGIGYLSLDTLKSLCPALALGCQQVSLPLCVGVAPTWDRVRRIQIKRTRKHTVTVTGTNPGRESQLSCTKKKCIFARFG